MISASLAKEMGSTAQLAKELSVLIIHALLNALADIILTQNNV